MNEILAALGTIAMVGVFVLLGWFIKQAQAEDRSCAGENDTGSGWGAQV